MATIMEKENWKYSELGMQKAQFVIPKVLHKRFKRIALEDETTMSNIVVYLIEAYVEKREKELS